MAIRSSALTGCALFFLFLAAGAGKQPVSTTEQRRAALGPLEGMDPVLRKAVDNETAFLPLPAPEAGEWLSAHPEEGQTFEQFVASRPNRPYGGKRTIYLLPTGPFPPNDAPSLDFLRRFTEAYFGLPVRVLPHLSLAGQKVAQRILPGPPGVQLLTGDILKILRQHLPPDAYCLLGVTMVDLYPGRSWNFVFGQASLTGRVGVYSFARYAPFFYGESSPDAKKIVLLRSCRVLAHETGHMFGLKHCVYYSCLMNGSNSMLESDAQPLHLCPVCLRKLQWSADFDVARRYERLRDLCREAGFANEARWLDGQASRLESP